MADPALLQHTLHSQKEEELKFHNQATVNARE